LSINHAEVSAVVAQKWQLPEHLVRSMQHHHRPRLFDRPLCHGLYIANQLARQLENSDDGQQPEKIVRCLSTESLRLSRDQLKEIFG